MANNRNRAHTDPWEALEIGNSEAAVQPLNANASLEMSDSPPEQAASGRHPQQEGTPWRRFALKVCMSVTAFVALTFLLEKFADEEVTAFAGILMDHIGLPGLFLIVFLADGLPQPFTYVPLIFMAVKGSVPKPLVFGVCALGSYIAALVGYTVGLHLRTLQWGNNLFTRLAEEHPYVPELMQRRGAAGVAIAALLPIPLALATWTAGSFKVSLPHFMLAGMCRMPKILFFVLLSRAPRPAVDPASVPPPQLFVVS